MLRAKFFFAASFVLGFASGQTALTSQSVLDDIHAKGAQAVINHLYNDGHEGQQWERLLNKIETGADGWLDVAEKLYPATDAATRVGMNVSIAVALTRNPAAVLQRTGRADWPTLDKVCTVPFIESDPKTDIAHIQSVRAALRRVAISSLNDKKAECLKLINADAEHLKR